VNVVLGVKWPFRIFSPLHLRKCVGLSDSLAPFLLPRLNVFSCQDIIPQAKNTVATSLSLIAIKEINDIDGKLV